MESNKRPLKRLPQVTLWELQRHTVTIRNPLAWEKTPSDKPIERSIVDLSELCLHRAGEGSKPIFDRDDIIVNNDGIEQRTMKVQRSPRSRSSSSSVRSKSSESKGSKGPSKSTLDWLPSDKKLLKFTCEKKTPESQKDRRTTAINSNNKRKRDRNSRSPFRRQSVSPFRKQYRRTSRSSTSSGGGDSPDRRVGSPSTSGRLPVKHYNKNTSQRSPVHSRLGRLSPDRRHRSPDRRAKTPDKRARSPDRRGRSPDRRGRSPDRRGRSGPRLEKSPQRMGRSPPRGGRSPYRSGRSPGRLRRSPERSKEVGRRRSRSLSASRGTRRSPPRRSRSPHRPSARYREGIKGRRSPSRRTVYSPHREEEAAYLGQNPGQIPPIDYAHLAHVITQMYPRQQFIPPPIIPQPPEFYPPYGIPQPVLPPRPRFPPRPPIIYNNRSIKIYRPTDVPTTSSSVTSTVTTTANTVSTTKLTTSNEHEKSSSESNVNQDTSIAASGVSSSGENPVAK